jgi:hypothetical protein
MAELAMAELAMAELPYGRVAINPNNIPIIFE